MQNNAPKKIVDHHVKQENNYGRLPMEGWRYSSSLFSNLICALDFAPIHC